MMEYKESVSIPLVDKGASDISRMGFFSSLNVYYMGIFSYFGGKVYHIWGWGHIVEYFPIHRFPNFMGGGILVIYPIIKCFSQFFR